MISDKKALLLLVIGLVLIALAGLLYQKHDGKSLIANYGFGSPNGCMVPPALSLQEDIRLEKRDQSQAISSISAGIGVLILLFGFRSIRGEELNKQHLKFKIGIVSLLLLIPLVSALFSMIFFNYRIPRTIIYIIFNIIPNISILLSIISLIKEGKQGYYIMFPIISFIFSYTILMGSFLVKLT